MTDIPEPKPPPAAIGCILTGDHEADLDCTQFHEDAPWTCCKWCERDGGQHCGMCDSFDAGDDEDPDPDPCVGGDH